MENSLDSTNPEPSVPVLKSIFKNRNFDATFEVSMIESPTVEVDKSILDVNTSKSNKFLPFKRKRKSVQGLNVSAHESIVNSENEESHVFAKPRNVFARKQTADSFNVTFAESNSGSNTMESFSEESIINKRNLFKQINKKNDLSKGVVSSDGTDVDNHMTLADLADSDSENTDLTTFLTKPNLFKENTRNATDNIDVSRNDSVRSGQNGSIMDADSSSWIMKRNPFKSRKSTEQNSSLSQNLSHVPQNLSPAEMNSFQDSQRNKSCFTDKESSNLSINVSKPQSPSCVNESSINDENLNHWMSEESEDEVSPPTIPTVPTVTKNTSAIEERLQKTPVAEKSPERPNWEEKVKEIMSQFQKKTVVQLPTPHKVKPKKNPPPKNQEKKYRAKLIKPAPFVTKRLYNFILKKFQPRYGVDAVIEAEDMISAICDTVKKVLRRKAYQKTLIQSLKQKMAKAELIETTVEFYEFVIAYLPYDFRVKVVPCLQPVTNTVYPPKDVLNPFDKIL